MDCFSGLSLTTKIILILSLIATIVVSVTFIVTFIVASIVLATTAWPVMTAIALGLFIISLNYH